MHPRVHRFIRPPSSTARLVGLATAVPRHAATQAQTSRFLQEMARARPGVAPRFVDAVQVFGARSGIQTRYSVMQDYLQTDPSKFTFFPPNWALEPLPTTADRMRVFEAESVPLAAAAATRALTDAQVTPREVTHLIVTTCTGFFAPGPDIRLMECLGLPPGVERTQIGFMGCYAGINGVRLADRIVRSQPSAVVLQVSVELCSLHLQADPNLDTLVANLLFADGAFAAVFAGEARGKNYGTIAAGRSAVAPDSGDQMRWDVGDHGFVMRLAGAVPQTLGKHAPSFVAALLDGADVQGRLRWAIHPGGKKIVDRLAQVLELSGDDVASSREVLRDVGNVSSATIGFVLLEELARASSGESIVLLGFGPGLTMEGAVLHVA